jgi:hypothetical protein
MKTKILLIPLLAISSAIYFSVIPPHKSSAQNAPADTAVAGSVITLDTSALTENMKRSDAKVENLKRKTKTISRNSKDIEQETIKIQKSVAVKTVAEESPVDTVAVLFPVDTIKPVKHNFWYRVRNVFNKPGK